MKQSRKITALLAAMLVLIMMLLFANQGMLRQNAQVAVETATPIASPSATISPLIRQSTSTPVTLTFFTLTAASAPDFLTHVALTLTARPTFTPEATSTLEPHACVFPLAQTTRKESMPQNYTFSEPQVVLTGDYPNIAGWLPDNQNAIIMPMKAHQFDGIDGRLQTIELFNPETKETHVYATRRNFGEEPLAWNSALNAIIYPAPNVLGIDKTNNRLTVTRQIKISDGNPDTTQLLLDNLQDYYPITFKPDGSQFVYWANSGKQNFKLYKHQVSQELSEPEYLIPFDSALFGSEGYSRLYDMTWRPNASQLFLYSGNSPTSQTFLVDVNTGQSCILNFDGWVYFARWSPNGRYLAVITSHGPGGPIWVNYDLSVLDTLTGDLHKIDTAKINPPHLAHFIGDLSWAPDNHHLAIIEVAYAASTSPPPSIDRLYLVDFLSGEVSNPFPAYQFNTGWWGTGLAWSPDGTKIMAKCPIENEGRLCLVPVQTGGQ